MLVISTSVDAATDLVVEELEAKDVLVTRLNTECYPFESRLTTKILGQLGESVRLSISDASDRVVALQDVISVWYRRVRVPENHAGLDSGIYDFCVREGRAALIGSLLGAVPHKARWMSHPADIWKSEHKVYQLKIAQQCGLRVPETLITNDAREVRSAFERFDKRMIAKPVRSGYIEINEQPHAIYTSEILEEHLHGRPATEPCPTIYQPLLGKQCDVRVTVVGDKIFSALIHSQTDPEALIDWRQTQNPDLPHTPIRLSPSLSQAILQFVNALGLAFAAIDFVLTPEGEYYFLEVNPNGQWLWIDDKLNLGITSEVVNWLCRA